MSAKERADKVFSLCVRERAGNRCQACIPSRQVLSRYLHCSHLVNGRRFSVRWNPYAAAAHCWFCHDHLGHRPTEMKKWRREYLGKERAAEIEALRNKSLRLNPDQIEDIHANLKASYEHMLAQRAAGESGWIEFESPYPGGAR